MNIGILGSGMVAQALGARLSELGRSVMLGTPNIQIKIVR